tara:strand:- start:519 stop:683 length:165 start_codon:yes stop_codon:yes gene_type:complete
MIAQIPQDRYQYCATCQTGFCGLFSAADGLDYRKSNEVRGITGRNHIDTDPALK